MPKWKWQRSMGCDVDIDTLRLHEHHTTHCTTVETGGHRHGDHVHRIKDAGLGTSASHPKSKDSGVFRPQGQTISLSSPSSSRGFQTEFGSAPDIMLFRHSQIWSLALYLGVVVSQGPFLTQIDDQTWVFGNDLWNVTQGANYATKLFSSILPGQDLVGTAYGHYSDIGM